MSAQEIVLCKTTDIESACKKAGLPTVGATKSGMATALAGLGWSAAQVRSAGGAGPSRDDLAILESRINSLINDEANKLALQINKVDKASANALNAFEVRVTSAIC